jgi:hypothetical protein
VNTEYMLRHTQGQEHKGSKWNGKRAIVMVTVKITGISDRLEMDTLK